MAKINKTLKKIEGKEIKKAILSDDGRILTFYFKDDTAWRMFLAFDFLYDHAFNMVDINKIDIRV